jgi:TetR/AcrR family transcriptional regulator, transcriptional repressor for nem operon
VSGECPTKQRIIEAAEPLMLEKGFHAAGLSEILAAVNVPKGSFYHHFKSKEQFGVELLEHYIAQALEYKSKLLLSQVPEADPLARLLNFFESKITESCEAGGRCSCLVLKLATEVTSFSEPMREVLADGMRKHLAILGQVLQEGIDKGRIRQIDTAATAATLTDLWNGAMQRSTIASSTVPLREGIQFIRNLLSP